MTDTKETISIIDSIIAHFNKSGRIAPKYRRYLTERVVSYREFNDYYRRLDPGERDPKDTTTEGIIKHLSVVEDGEWLSFRADYVDRLRHRMITDHEVLKCRFQDRAIRTFIQNEINVRGSSNRGRRLLDKILMTKIPAFHKMRDQDAQLIRKQMDPYLKDYNVHQVWEKEYMALDEKWNRKVYALYGLMEEEIKYVEDNSRPNGWHVD